VNDEGSGSIGGELAGFLQSLHELSDVVSLCITVRNPILEQFNHGLDLLTGCVCMNPIYKLKEIMFLFSSDHSPLILRNLT
jgi:hypothetical protein